jgi:hypothetical protein
VLGQGRTGQVLPASNAGAKSSAGAATARRKLKPRKAP